MQMATPSLSAILRHAKPVFRETLKAARPTLQNTLPNGFRIASEAKDGDTCTTQACLLFDINEIGPRLLTL